MYWRVRGRGLIVGLLTPGRRFVFLPAYVVEEADRVADLVEVNHKASTLKGTFRPTNPRGTYRVGHLGEIGTRLCRGLDLTLWTPEYKPDGGQDLPGIDVKATDWQRPRWGIKRGQKRTVYFQFCWVKRLGDGRAYVYMAGWLDWPRWELTRQGRVNPTHHNHYWLTLLTDLCEGLCP